jgi:hypothetical protein
MRCKAYGTALIVGVGLILASGMAMAQTERRIAWPGPQEPAERPRPEAPAPAKPETAPAGR